MTLTFSIPDTVCAIIQRLESHGYEAYAVGGCVRDMPSGAGILCAKSEGGLAPA